MNKKWVADSVTTMWLFWVRLWPTNPGERGRAELQGDCNQGSSGNTHTHTHTPCHLLVSLLCHGKDMWVHVSHVLPAVSVDYVRSIDRQRLVRVDGHENDSCGRERNAHLVLRQRHTASMVTQRTRSSSERQPFINGFLSLEAERTVWNTFHRDYKQKTEAAEDPNVRPANCEIAHFETLNAC